jgi:hypothetical protein
MAAAHDSVKITIAAETARAYAQICAVGERLEVARHGQRRASGRGHRGKGKCCSRSGGLLRCI